MTDARGRQQLESWVRPWRGMSDTVYESPSSTRYSAVSAFRGDRNKIPTSASKPNRSMAQLGRTPNKGILQEETVLSETVITSNGQNGRREHESKKKSYRARGSRGGGSRRTRRQSRAAAADSRTTLEISQENVKPKETEKDPNQNGVSKIQTDCVVGEMKRPLGQFQSKAQQATFRREDSLTVNQSVPSADRQLSRTAETLATRGEVPSFGLSNLGSIDPTPGLQLATSFSSSSSSSLSPRRCTMISSEEGRDPSESIAEQERARANYGVGVTSSENFDHSREVGKFSTKTKQTESGNNRAVPEEAQLTRDSVDKPDGSSKYSILPSLPLMKEGAALSNFGSVARCSTQSNNISLTYQYLEKETAATDANLIGQCESDSHRLQVKTPIINEPSIRSLHQTSQQSIYSILPPLPPSTDNRPIPQKHPMTTCSSFFKGQVDHHQSNIVASGREIQNTVFSVKFACDELKGTNPYALQQHTAGKFQQKRVTQEYDNSCTFNKINMKVQTSAPAYSCGPPDSSGDSLKNTTHYAQERIQKQRKMLSEGGSLFLISPKSFLMGGSS